MKRVVIVHKKDGLFVGTAMGLAFFSNLDAVGQTTAPAFDNEEKAKEFLTEIGVNHEKFEFHTVEAIGTHANLTELINSDVPVEFVMPLLNNTITIGNA